MAPLLARTTLLSPSTTHTAIMGAILSKKESKQHNKSNTITPLDRAILDLKNSRDRLTKYRTKLDQDCTKLTTRAASLHSSGKTSTALQLLRLRKYKLKEAERVDEQLLTVLRMVDKIAEKQNEAELVEAMRRGKDALRILHEEMGVEDVLSLMDEIRDQVGWTVDMMLCLCLNLFRQECLLLYETIRMR